MFTIVIFGKIKDSNIQELVDKYLQLSNKYNKVGILELKDPNRKITSDDLANLEGHLVLLTENAREYTSVEFANQIETWKLNSVKPKFVVGNAWGFEREVLKSANQTLSLGKMTFPHEISLVLLLEQIFRCGNINSGGNYHK